MRDSGHVKELGVTIRLSCPDAGVGFSGGPVFDNWADHEKVIGAITRVDEDAHICYAANVSLIRELIRRPSRNTLFRWIEAAETRFSNYRTGTSEIWTPHDAFPRADYCSGWMDSHVGCTFQPINTLESGVASFDEMIGRVAASLGSEWRQDDSLRTKFNKDGYRRVTFATSGRSTRVNVDLSRSGEWYQVSVGVASGAR
jgi:hypothetical protein